MFGCGDDEQYKMLSVVSAARLLCLEEMYAKRWSEELIWVNSKVIKILLKY